MPHPFYNTQSSHDHNSVLMVLAAFADDYSADFITWCNKHDVSCNDSFESIRNSARKAFRACSLAEITNMDDVAQALLIELLKNEQSRLLVLARLVGKELSLASAFDLDRTVCSPKFVLVTQENIQPALNFMKKLKLDSPGLIGLLSLNTKQFELFRKSYVSVIESNFQGNPL